MERPAETEKFLNQVLVNKRSRENAESTRLNLKKKLPACLCQTKALKKS